MRVLFFNEGNLGTHILGQGQLDAALRIGVGEADGLEARFAGLAPLGRWSGAAASRPVPLMGGVDEGLSTLRWHLVQSLRARAALRRELAAWPADLVHLHSQSVAMLAGPRITGAPVVVSLDTTVRDWSQMPAWRAGGHAADAALAPSRALERRTLRAAPLVLAWTAWARRAVERDAPGANVAAHHPGLDLSLYRPAERRERALPRILFVGGRFAEKGGEDLLEALGEDLGVAVELDIVTAAPVAARPGVRVHRLSPGDPRLLDLHQQADVLCLPTYGDTNPWAILEAMACGTPVVASAVGAIPELLDGGRTGVIAPYGDPARLGDALRALLGDPARRRGLAAAGRELCERRYDARRQFPLLVELLTEVQARFPRRTSKRTSSAPNARNPNNSAG
jgi:glycosyltransferase involved in cell wall biosynthesis